MQIRVTSQSSCLLGAEGGGAKSGGVAKQKSAGNAEKLTQASLQHSAPLPALWQDVATAPYICGTSCWGVAVRQALHPLHAPTGLLPSVRPLRPAHGGLPQQRRKGPAPEGHWNHDCAHHRSSSQLWRQGRCTYACMLENLWGCPPPTPTQTAHVYPACTLLLHVRL